MSTRVQIRQTRGGGEERQNEVEESDNLLQAKKIYIVSDEWMNRRRNMHPRTLVGDVIDGLLCIGFFEERGPKLARIAGMEKD